MNHRLREVFVVDSDEPPPLPIQPDRSVPQGASVPFRQSENLYPEGEQRIRNRLFPDADDVQWEDWRWQYAHRIRSYTDLSRVLDFSDDERKAVQGGAGTLLNLPYSITPWYLSLLDPDNPDQPLRKTVIPTLLERIRVPGEAVDPLGEEHDSPVPGIVHRYPDRVLLLVAGSCAVYCRYCTRSRYAGKRRNMTWKEFETAVAYIRSRTEIRDVIVSGGDPLTLSDRALDRMLTELYAIPHVEMVRIGTKAPMVLPMRITGELVSVLRKFRPLYVSIHATHPDEITPRVSRAADLLIESGAVLGSQTVLLKGVNDSADVLKTLFHKLLAIRIRPYYLYQCDPAAGTSHFRTTLESGMQIMRQLYGFTSGYAIPQYIVDTPGGGGKVPVCPDYIIARDGDAVWFRSWDGSRHAYPERGTDREVV